MSQKKDIYIVGDTHLRHGETGQKAKTYAPGSEIKLTADEAKGKAVILKSDLKKVIVEGSDSSELAEKLVTAQTRITELETALEAEKQKTSEAEAKVTELETKVEAEKAKK